MPKYNGHISGQYAAALVASYDEIHFTYGPDTPDARRPRFRRLWWLAAVVAGLVWAVAIAVNGG